MTELEIENQKLKKANEDLLNAYSKYYKYEKMNLDSKQIFKLRRKIKQLKEDGYDNKLRAITLYTHSNDEHLKVYINKLYLQYFQD